VCAQAQQDDDAAVVLVGDMTREQNQQQKRQELGKTDQAQIEHAAGKVIDLPADGHDDHLRGNGGTEPRAEIQGEIAILEHRESALDAVGAQEKEWLRAPLTGRVH
jgi:hypothetical protein